MVLFVLVIAVCSFAQEFSDKPILWRKWLSNRYPVIPFGPFVVENHFGGLTGLTFPFVLMAVQASYHFASSSKGDAFEDRSGGFFAKIFDEGTVLYFFATLLIICACFFSFARTSSFVIVGIGLIYFFMSGAWKKWWAWLILIAAVGLVYLSLLFIGFEKFIEQFEYQKLLEDGTSRYQVWLDGAKLLSEYPIFGVGAGTFIFISSSVIEWRTNFLMFSDTMNHQLELFITTGMVGASLFYACIGSILVTPMYLMLHKQHSFFRSLIAKQALLAIIAVAIMEITDYQLKIPCLALLFIFQLSLLFQNSLSHPIRIRKRDSLPLNAFAKGFLGISILLMIAFVLPDTYRWAKIDGYMSKQWNRDIYLARAVEIEPNDPRLWQQLAKSYELIGLEADDELTEVYYFSKTAKALEQAVELAPTRGFYRFHLATLQERLGLYEQARKTMEEAIKWAPSKIRYRIYYVSILMSLEADVEGDRDGEISNILTREMNHIDAFIRMNPRFVRHRDTKKNFYHYLRLLIWKYESEDGDEAIRYRERIQRIYEDIFMSPGRAIGKWAQKRELGEEYFEKFLVITGRGPKPKVKKVKEIKSVIDQVSVETGDKKEEIPSVIPSVV